MKQSNINAIAEFFGDNPEGKLVTLRYTFSVEDDDGKEKICCEIVCGDFEKHRRFLRVLVEKAMRGYVEYLHEFNISLLYGGEKNIFLLKEEEKEGDEQCVNQ